MVDLDIIRELRTIRAAFGIGMKQTFRYPTWFINAFVGPFVWTTTFIMTYKCMLSSSAVQNFAQLSGGITDITSFVILGSGIAFYWLSMIFGTGYFIENQRGAGTLELLFLTPTNRVALLLGVALQDFVFSSMMVGMTVSLCSILFGLNVHIVDPLGLVACFLLTVTALYSVGLFFASFFVLTRAARLLGEFLQAPIMYLSGMNFPMEAIPKMLLFLSALIPITFGIDGIRKMSLAGASLDAIWYDILGLVIHTIAFSALAIWGLKYAEKQALRKGDISFY